MIDELLCDIRQEARLSWAQMYTRSSVTAEAMQRLRSAWERGRMPLLTLGLAEYFGARGGKVGA